MDKIIEKLAGVLSAEDLNEVKAAFEAAVTERLQAKLDEETSNLAKKAEEFCQLRIKEAVEKKTAELENLANKYCEERCAKITEKAQARLDAQTKQLEEAAQQYIYMFFEEKYQERCGEDLKELEESLIGTLDNYLEYTISEKISPALIKKTAINETYEPIIKLIQNAFEDKFVPLDTTGTRKIQECKVENAQLRKDLATQCNEVHRLNEMVDKANKRALIAEKTAGMTPNQVARVKNIFESKSYATTKKEIDSYVEVMNERAPIMKRPTQRLQENTTLKTKSLNVEDTTEDIITEKFQPKKKMSQTDSFLLQAAHFSREK